MASHYIRAPAHTIPIPRHDGVGQLVRHGGIPERVVVQRADAMRQIQRLNLGQVCKTAKADQGLTLGYGHSFERCGHIGSVRFICTCPEDITKPRILLIIKACTDERQCDFFKFIAILKRANTDDQIPLVGVRHGQFSDLSTKECVVTDVNQGFGRGKLTRNAGIGKRIGVDALDNTAFADWNTVNLGATVEREVGNFYDGIGNRDVFKANITTECALINTLELVILCEVYSLQILAVCKGIVVD